MSMFSRTREFTGGFMSHSGQEFRRLIPSWKDDGSSSTVVNQLADSSQSSMMPEANKSRLRDGNVISTQSVGGDGSGSHSSRAMALSNVDVDALLEDYAWKQFKDIQSVKRTRLDEFKDLEKDDVEFVINTKRLQVIHGDPEYKSFSQCNARPYTLFKSIFTNNTDRKQEYSFKTERSTESLCSVCREQGYSMGGETELTLKTPCEIAELKAGFKREVNFSKLNEDTQSESMTWGVDSNVVVPAHYATEASIVIEEMTYKGSYVVYTWLAGTVTISIRRRKDNALVLPLTVNIVEVFREHLSSSNARKEVKAGVMIEGNQKVRLISKGTCQFQCALKQRIELREEAITDRERMMVD